MSRKAFFIGHMGLGDHITCLPIVRYLATKYDEVKVVCKKQNLNNLISFYSDNSIITFYPIDALSDICVHHNCPEDKFKEIVKGYDVYSCGFHNIEKDSKIYNIPFCFYDDVHLPHSIFWDYFHLPDLKESKELYKNVKDIPYVFIHNSSSFGKMFDTLFIEMKYGITEDDILYVNPNKNMYTPDHKFYELAQNFVNKPLLYYKDTIINASKLFLTDSSFFCMAINLEIKTPECYYISRLGDYSYMYTEYNGFDSSKKRQIFKSMTN